MKNSKQKGLVLIGCGGAGTNVVGNLSEPLKDLGEGFSKITTEYIDTSYANIKNFDHDETNFHLVKSTNVGEEISGSASERRENSAHIIESVREWINDKKYSSKDIATYYIVVASASGGSGSVIAPMVVKNLLEKGLPVIIVLIGDSSNGLATINTLNTIATMNAIARQTKKPISVIFQDNAKGAGDAAKGKLESIDTIIFKNLCVLSAFLSGNADALDQKDMAAFIDQSVYSTIGIKPGLYGLNLFTGDVDLPPHITPTIARTLTTRDVSSDINIDLFHHKFGVTRNQNVIDRFKGQFPIHVVTFANSFSIIEMELQDKVDKVNAALEASTVDNVTGTAEADDDGLVL